MRFSPLGIFLQHRTSLMLHCPQKRLSKCPSHIQNHFWATGRPHCQSLPHMAGPLFLQLWLEFVWCCSHMSRCPNTSLGTCLSLNGSGSGSCKNEYCLCGQLTVVVSSLRALWTSGTRGQRYSTGRAAPHQQTWRSGRSWPPRRAWRCKNPIPLLNLHYLHYFLWHVIRRVWHALVCFA